MALSHRRSLLAPAMWGPRGSGLWPRLGLPAAPLGVRTAPLSRGRCLPNADLASFPQASVRGPFCKVCAAWGSLQGVAPSVIILF